MMSDKQKQELAVNYLREKKISFGSREADDRAIEMFIAGLEHNEDKHEAVLKHFKETYQWLFKFHCEEYLKLFQKTIPKRQNQLP